MKPPPLTSQAVRDANRTNRATARAKAMADPVTREAWLAEQRRNGAERRDRIRSMVREAKAGGCMDCGRTDLPPEVLDLHHVRGSKLFSLASAAKHPVWRVEEELAKCDPICPTCHALRHYRARTLAVGRFV